MSSATHISAQRATGWKPMPLSLKIIFVIFICGLLSISSDIKTGFTFFGFHLYGIWALGVVILLDYIGTFILLYAMFRRLSWTWLYAIIYISYWILDMPSGFPDLIATFKTTALPTAHPLLIRIMYISVILVSESIKIIYLLVFYRQRFYFKQESKI